jgi:hypothetical protein
MSALTQTHVGPTPAAQWYAFFCSALNRVSKPSMQRVPSGFCGRRTGDRPGRLKSRTFALFKHGDHAAEPGVGDGHHEYKTNFGDKRSTFTVQRTGRRQWRRRQACHMSALSLCEDWENPFFWGADMSAPSQVGFVAQTVGAALDHPDLVLEPLDEAERDLVLRPAVGGDAVPMPVA